MQSSADLSGLRKARLVSLPQLTVLPASVRVCALGKEEKEVKVGTITEVGFGLSWDYPVLVREGDFDDKRIEGPRAALKYLDEGFTIKSGKRYQTAVTACRSALRSPCDLEASRACFIAAYAEFLSRAAYP